MGARKGAGQSWTWWAACLSVVVPAAVGMVLLNRASAPLDVPSYYVYGELALVALAVLLQLRLLDAPGRQALGWLSIAVLSGAFLFHGTVMLNYSLDSLPREPVAGTEVSSFLRDAAWDAGYYSTYFGMPLAVDPQLRTATTWYLRRRGT